jgi:hypothetical protein
MTVDVALSPEHVRLELRFAREVTAVSVAGSAFAFHAKQQSDRAILDRGPLDHPI